MADRLVATWQAQLCRYIAQEGGGDEAVLAELKMLRSRNALRAARVRFGVLDVDTGAGRWDVQGVLVGRQKNGVFVRYVFALGIVGHGAYLSSEVRDLRLVALSPVAGTLVWETSAADATAVDRYRKTFGTAAVSRFPADDDDFRMHAARDRVSVQELRSGAEWSLAVRPDLRDLRGMVVSYARHAPSDHADDPCRPR